MQQNYKYAFQIRGLGTTGRLEMESNLKMKQLIKIENLD